MFRPKDKYGNNLATSKTSVDISLCSQNCNARPGFAALWMTAFCSNTATYYSIRNKYSTDSVQVSAGQSQPISVELSPLTDGSYQGRLSFPDPATYMIDLLLNSTSISGSPFQVMVFPESNDPEPTLCTAEFSPSVANSTFTAGSVLSISIFARNKYGVLLDNIDSSKFNMQVQNFPNIPLTTGNDPRGKFSTVDAIYICGQ